jgi:hypothetical protein
VSSSRSIKISNFIHWKRHKRNAGSVKHQTGETNADCWRHLPAFALKAVKGGPEGLKPDTAVADISTATDAG